MGESGKSFVCFYLLLRFSVSFSPYCLLYSLSSIRCWQNNIKGGASADLAHHLYITVIFLYNPVHDRETEACAALFCREEWVEYLYNNFLWYARTSIRDRNLYTLPV